MPLFRSAGRLIHFAHVPKCAGTAVESYLRDRFGPLAFMDYGYLRCPPAERWTASSPQHVDAAAFARLFPPGFIDASFAVVRNPVERLVSVWHFQSEKERATPVATSFSEWLEDIGDRLQEDRFALDNHLRPMVDMIPPDSRIFRLEEGLGGLVSWLDELTGSTDGPREITPSNRRADRFSALRRRITPGPADLEVIARIYAADFAAYGYALPDGTRAAPPARAGGGGLLGRLRGVLGAGPSRGAP